MSSHPQSTPRVFVSDNVLLPGADDPTPATIEVDLNDGRIKQIVASRRSRTDYADVKDVDWVDVGALWILPGLVDAHVHLNDPGRTAWEGFTTGTLAAASGGVTTLIDMPLNSIPPTTTVENLKTKRDVASGKCWVDVGFWGGVVPGNEKELRPMVEAGVRGFKGFMIESGVEEFPCISDKDIIKAMTELHDTPTTLLFHAELEDTHAHDKNDGDEESDPTLYSTFLASRPPSLETNAIERIISLQKQHVSSSLRCHIVHLSASEAIPAIKAAQAAMRTKDGEPRLTAETCFHYLTLSANTIPDANAAYKCCPPIRTNSNRDQLWEALLDGTINCIVSDHSPCTIDLKRPQDGDLMRAWGGISGLGLGLSLLWTEGKLKRGVSAGKLVWWISGAAAKHVGLDHRKGSIKVGLDADLAVFDPTQEFDVTEDVLEFKNKKSAYEGVRLTGRVVRTFVRGQCIWDLGKGGKQGEPIGVLL